MSSTNFYNDNAEEFYISTVEVDMSELYSKFEKYLQPNTKILDAGCGSGRDSKYFLEKGYKVTAIDGSIEMVKKAKELTGLDVQHMFFEDIEDKYTYDGIWACATLLHIPKKDIEKVFTKFIDALKEDAIWYMSFKYGDTERTKDGRLFNDYTETSMQNLISKFEQLQIKELWFTDDKREDRNDKWINIIVKKSYLN